MAGSYATPSSFPAPAGVTAPVLEVSVVESGRATVLRVSGEIDMATAGVLRRALAEQRGAVVLDLRDVEFIAVEGIHVLLEADARSRSDGLSLTLIPGPVVERLLGLTGARERFRLQATELDLRQ
jgi:anti-sigma B factor antagonist